MLTFPYKLIDLTHTLEPSIPTWNGSCGFNHTLHIDYADCPGPEKFRVMKLSMHAGIGTHMDAPAHCIPGGKYITDFTVQELCMPCIVIDISSKADERYSLTPEDIATFEQEHGPISKGSCVLVKTGWQRHWNTPEEYHNNHVFPSVSADAAQVLLEKGVAALGIDTLSADRPTDGFKVHQAFLGAGKILLENVAHLDSMPPVGTFVMIAPLKIKEGTEAPVRLIGFIPNESLSHEC